jgi:hypothetical protein
MEVELLELLKSRPTGHQMSDEEITDGLACGDRLAYLAAAYLISKGTPVCMSPCDGWKDPADSEPVVFWLTDDLSDLDSMAEMIRWEKGIYEGMLAGIDKAKQNLLTPPAQGSEGRSDAAPEGAGP